MDRRRRGELLARHGRAHPALPRERLRGDRLHRAAGARRRDHVVSIRDAGVGAPMAVGRNLAGAEEPMSYVTVNFPEPREVFIDDQPQGSNRAASGRLRTLFVNSGILEGLGKVRYQSGTRVLLDDVDVISSVSGGSFTAAYYALFGADGFARFEQDFLYRNIQGALVLRALAPWNWLRLLRHDYSR